MLILYLLSCGTLHMYIYDTAKCAHYSSTYCAVLFFLLAFYISPKTTSQKSAKSAESGHHRERAKSDWKRKSTWYIYININMYTKTYVWVMKKKRKATIVLLHLLLLLLLVGAQSFFCIGHKVGYNLLQKVDPKNGFFKWTKNLSLFLGRKSNHAIRNDSWADQGEGRVGKELNNPYASQWTVHDLPRPPR